MKRHFIENPSKKTVIIVTLLWGIATLLILLAASDLFSKSIFQKEYLMLYLLNIGASVMLVKLYVNYIKMRHPKSK